jgi:hypothetical protein
MSIKVTQENYSAYKKVYEIICSHLFRELKTLLPQEANPVALLDQWEENSWALARKGLQSGLNDCLSSVDYWPKEMFAGINSELERNELPNVVTLTGLMQKIIKQVLKTRRIKNIYQYYVVKEILDDTTSEITADERSTLGNYFRDFEMPTSR